MTDIKKFPDSKLSGLKFILNWQNKVVTSGDIGSSLKKKDLSLGGTVSMLLQTQFEGEPLLIGIGLKNRQMNYVLNPKLTSEKKNIFLKEIEEEILRRKTLKI